MRRGFALVLAFVLTGLITTPADAKTISALNNQNQTIDNGKGTTAVKVDFRGTVRDVNLRIYEISHTFPDDMDITLVHGDRRVRVMSDVGGEHNVTNIQLTFDDEAVDYLPNDTQLTSTVTRPTDFEGNDQVKPKQRLSDFDGMSSRGRWDLVVVDDVIDDTTYIGGWELTIRARR